MITILTICRQHAAESIDIRYQAPSVESLKSPLLRGALAMTDQLSTQIVNLLGRQRTWRFEVTARDIKRFSQAIGESNPIHYDEEYARNSKHGGIVAPPLFCQAMTYHDAPPEDLLPDGSPLELSVPVPATRTVGGGSEYTIYRLVRPGDVIEVTSTLKDVRTKEGRSGLLYLIVVETTFADHDRQPVATEVATYIKRA